jgi:hypothetical protein
MLGKLAIAAGLTAALAAPAGAGTGLERFQWQHRLLLVFAPDAGHPDYRRQRDIVDRHADGVAERDMVIVAVVGDQPVTVSGTPAKDLDAAALRRRFEVPRDRFAAILVGKDGTAKLRRGTAITAGTLFETIDAMPMRQREIRRDADP